MPATKVQCPLCPESVYDNRLGAHVLSAKHAPDVVLLLKKFSHNNKLGLNNWAHLISRRELPRLTVSTQPLYLCFGCKTVLRTPDHGSHLRSCAAAGIHAEKFKAVLDEAFKAEEEASHVAFEVADASEVTALKKRVADLEQEMKERDEAEDEADASYNKLYEKLRLVTGLTTSKHMDDMIDFWTTEMPDFKPLAAIYGDVDMIPMPPPPFLLMPNPAVPALKPQPASIPPPALHSVESIPPPAVPKKKIKAKGAFTTMTRAQLEAIDLETLSPSDAELFMPAWQECMRQAAIIEERT